MAPVTGYCREVRPLMSAHAVDGRWLVMGFLKRNKFTSDWGMAMMYTPMDLGIVGRTSEALEVMGQSIVTAATGAAQEAFDEGLAPDDAVLLGRTYLIAMLSNRYPDHVKKEALRPSVDEMSTVLAAKYGEDRIRKIRGFTEAFAAHNGVPLATVATRASIVFVVAKSETPIVLIDDPPVDEAVDDFTVWMLMHPRVKGLCEGILQSLPAPLSLLLVRKEDGGVLGTFEAAPERGLLSGLSPWQGFGEEVKRLIELDQISGHIQLPDSRLPPL